MASQAEQRSDVRELAGLRAGHWLYYEGSAMRVWGPEPGAIWGWYQIDAKFRPELDSLDLLLSFDSKNPNSIPSYKACFKMRWLRGKEPGAPPSSDAAAPQDEKLQAGLVKGAEPPPAGDWLIMDEATPRWRGTLVGGIGGRIHLINNFGDNLTFTPQPYVWHAFLSHIQREATDVCGVLVSHGEKKTLPGKRLRAW